MGGHHDGHEASKKVSRLVASNVLEQIYMPMLDTRRTASSIQHKPILEVMSDAIQTANQEIYNPEPSKDSGTTLTAGLIFGQRIFIAHIGDSRAYLLVDGELTLVTTDHSYVRRLIDAGQLTEEEAAVHPQRNMLYKAVGQGGTLEIDTFTRSLPKEGMLVLCSDGLWGLVNDSDMREVITSDRSYQAMVDELVEMALRAGGHDNVSVVLVVFSF
jgi:protein phosphatase